MRRTRLYGASRSRAKARISCAELRGRRLVLRERDEGLRHREPHRVGARHDGDFGHGLVLDQHALELERADAIVRRLEHVVGAADEGDSSRPRRASRRRRCGSSRRASRRRSSRRCPRSRPSARAARVAELQADLAFVGLRCRRRRAARRDSRAAAGPSSRASPAGPARCRSARWSRSGRSRRASVRPQASRTWSMISGIERLAGADQLAQLQAPAARGQVFLDQHAPHGRRRAQRGHAVALERRRAGRRR